MAPSPPGQRLGHRAPGQAPRARFPPALSPVLPGRTGGGDLYRNKSQPVLQDGDSRLVLFACTRGTLRATNRLENAAGCWCSVPGLLFCTSPHSARKQPSAPGAFCSPWAIQAGKGPSSPLCTSPKLPELPVQSSATCPELPCLSQTHFFPPEKSFVIFFCTSLQHTFMLYIRLLKWVHFQLICWHFHLDPCVSTSHHHRQPGRGLWGPAGPRGAPSTRCGYLKLHFPCRWLLTGMRRVGEPADHPHHLTSLPGERSGAGLFPSERCSCSSVTAGVSWGPLWCRPLRRCRCLGTLLSGTGGPGLGWQQQHAARAPLQGAAGRPQAGWGPWG